MPIDSIPNYAVFPGQLGKEDHINSRFFTGKLRRKEKQFTINLLLLHACPEEMPTISIQSQPYELIRRKQYLKFRSSLLKSKESLEV